MKRFVLTTLLATFMLFCVGALVIMAIEFYETRNQLTYLQTRHADKRELKRQIEQDLPQKDEYLGKLYNDPVFLERVVRERLGYVEPEEWIFRFLEPEEVRNGD